MMPAWFADLFTASALAALLQVVMIDLVLAGDNAIVIGLSAAGLPPKQRGRAILVGIVVATLLRIALASVALELLRIVGLRLAGGLLLLFVSWKLWRELRHPARSASDPDGTGAGAAREKTFLQAAWQITVADVSMSLDNVLAIAGAAREHPTVMAVGLALSVLLMAVAANLIARLLNTQRWIGYVGLAVIVYVALDMIYHGSLEVAGAG